MTETERGQLQDKCEADWQSMGEAERAAWGMQAEAKHLEAIVARHAAQALVPHQQPPPFLPWAGCGCRARPVPVESIAESLRRSRQPELRRQALHDPALSVGAAPIRASALPEGLEVQHTMWGCFASKQICRATLRPSIAAALDIIVHNMNSWVASLGAEVVKKAESLVCFRGSHPATGSRRDIACLLIFSRQQPTIHFYAMCDILGGSLEADVRDTMPEAPPFVASIGLGPCRMSNRWRSIDVKTNEEVALEMVSTHMEWNIVPLQWCLPEGASPLLDHIVTKVGDVYRPKAKVEKRKRDASDDITDQLADDPVAAGINAARTAAAASGVSLGRMSAPLSDTTLADGEAGVEAELFADLEVDVLDDLQLELFGEPPPLGDPGASLGDDDPPADEGDADEEDSEETGETSEEDGAADPLAEAVAHCKIDDKTGEVTCSIPPWNAYTVIGYFTSWPKRQKDRSLRSISCHCAMHVSCRSTAKVAHTTRLEVFLRWLLSGHRTFPGDSLWERKFWGEGMHPPIFHGIAAKFSPPSPRRPLPPADSEDPPPPEPEW